MTCSRSTSKRPGSSDPGRFCPQGQGGFSLIELTVVSLIIGIMLAGVVAALLPARNQVEEDAIVTGVSSIVRTVKANYSGQYTGLNETQLRDAGDLPIAFVRSTDNAVVTPYGGTVQIRQSSTLFLFTIPGTASTETATIVLGNMGETLCNRIVPPISNLVEMMWINNTNIMTEAMTSVTNIQAQAACSGVSNASLAMTFY